MQTPIPPDSTSHPRPTTLGIYLQLVLESARLKGFTGPLYALLLGIYALGMRLALGLDRLRHPLLGRTTMPQPIFVLGTGRDGAELVKKALVDGVNVVSVSPSNRFMPSLSARTLLRGPFEWLASHLFQGPVHSNSESEANVRDLPGADEALLLPTLRTPLITWLTPLAFTRQDLGTLYRPSSRDGLRLARALKGALQREWLSQRSKVSDEARILVHLPHGASWLEGLKQVFPDADVVVLRRDAHEAIPSLLASHRAHFARHPVLERAAESSLLRYFRRRYQHEVIISSRLQDRLSHAPASERLHTLTHQELKSRPEAALRSLVQTLGLTLVPAQERQLETAATQYLTKRYAHVPLPSDFGIGVDEIQQDLKTLATPARLRVVAA